MSTVSLLHTTFFKQVCTVAFSWGAKPSLHPQVTDVLDYPPLPSALTRSRLGKYLLPGKVRNNSCSVPRQVLFSCASLLVQMPHATCFNYPWQKKRGVGRGQEQVVRMNHDSSYLFFSKHYLTYRGTFIGSILTLRTLLTQSLIKAFAPFHRKPWKVLVDSEQGREFCAVVRFWVYGHPPRIWKRHKLISLLQEAALPVCKHPGDV